MATFKDTLKKWFYGSGAKAIANTSNVCLLDASGNPIGCDTIQRVSAFVLNPNDFVDMGLPSGRLWAKRNLGALKETDYGYYFSWGNLTGHSKGSGYNFSDATYNSSSAAQISANLTLAQDAARANKGEMWRMPASSEFGELFNSEYVDCVDANGNIITGTNKLTTYNNATGILLRSKANGNTLFFSVTGTYNGTTLEDEGSYGNYLSSTYYSETIARCLYFNNGSIRTESTFYGRRRGSVIRPVI